MMIFRQADRHSLLQGLLCLVLLGGTLSTSIAQPVGPDLRVLDQLPMALLPVDLRIQSGEIIDDNPLVVWGTTRALNGETAAALAVANGEGEMRYLTEPPAAPFGHVDVLKATDRFLVVWNDRRPDEPGIYARYLGRDGTPLSGEFRLISGGTMTALPLAFDNAGGTTIIWQGRIGEGEEGVYSVRVGHDGLIREEARYHSPGAIARSESFRRDAGGYFVRTESGPLVVNNAGEVLRSTIPADRFLRPFFFDGPTGMITTDHEGYLVRYDPIDASEPVWRDSGATGYYPGRDSLGFYLTTFRNDKIPQVFLTILIRTDTYVRDHEGGEIDLVRVDTVASVSYHNDPTPAIWVTERETNTIADGLTYYRFRWNCEWHPIASGRTYKSSNVHTIYLDSRLDRRIEPRHALRQPNTERLSFTTNSSVRLLRPDGSLLLAASAPIAAEITEWSASRPVLRRVGGTLLVGGVAEPDVFFGGALAPASLEIARPFDFVSSSYAQTYSYSDAWNAGGMGGTTSRQSSHEDQGQTITSNYTTFYWHTITPDGWKLTELYEGYVGGPVSFPTPVDPLMRYDPESDRIYAITTYRPPVRQSHYYYDFSRLVTLTDRLEIEESFRVDPQVTTVDFVPMDTHSLLHFRAVDSGSIIGREAVWNERQPSKTAIDQVAAGSDHVVRQRLFGERFIRLATLSEENRVAVDLFDLQGAPVAGILLPLDNATSRPAVAQSADDSTVIIVTPGRSGPLAYLLGPDLGPVITGVEEVVGPYRLSDEGVEVTRLNVMLIGDTIYGLWQDERRGVPDLYMNAVALPGGRYVESDPELYDYWEQYRDRDPEVTEQLTPAERQDIFGFAIYGVTPNPTHGDITMRIGAATTLGAYLEIFDAAGKRLYRGVLDLRVDLHDYRVPEEFGESGVYTVRISSPEYREEVRVVYLGQ